MAPQPAWVTGPRQGVPWATITQGVPRALHSKQTLVEGSRGKFLPARQVLLEPRAARACGRANSTHQFHRNQSAMSILNGGERSTNRHNCNPLTRVPTYVQLLQIRTDEMQAHGRPAKPPGTTPA